VPLAKGLITRPTTDEEDGREETGIDVLSVGKEKFT
jgi:hypothetical protein